MDFNHKVRTLHAPETTPLVSKWFGNQDTPIECWEQERIRAFQAEAVAKTLKHVYENNEFYRNSFDAKGVSPDDFKTLEDLAQFPFVEKDDLRGSPWKLICVPKKDLVLTHCSTGTTGGQHSYQSYTWDDVYVSELAAAMPKLTQVNDEDIVINALPYEMSSAGQSFQRAFQTGYGALVVPTGKGGFYADPKKTVQVIAEMEASILLTTPPYAMYLSELAEEMGYVLGKDIRLRLIWITGEGCSNAYRQRLEKIYGCPALLYYGSLEGGPIGIECNEQNGYHLTNCHNHLEIIDPETAEHLPEGEIGEVVITNLLRKGNPLVRYKVQDLAYVDDTPCPCGCTAPRLVMRGREVDQVHVSGRSYSPFFLEELLYQLPEVGHNYQFWVSEEKLVIELEVEMGVEPGDEIAEKIADHMQFYTDVPVVVEIVDHIPRTGGKTRRVRPLSEKLQSCQIAVNMEQPQ